MTVTAELDPTDPGVIVLDAAWNEFALLKTIPGVRWSSKQRRWQVATTWAAYCMLVQVVPGIVLGPALQEWATADWTTRVKPALDLRALIDWPAGWPDPGFDERLYAYQRVGVYMALLASADPVGAFAWGDEMSGGKGVQALCAWRMLHQFGEVTLPGLIVCPNNAMRHWSREVQRWFPEATPYIMPKGAVARRKAVREFEQDPIGIMICNYEAMRLVSRLAPYGDTALVKCVDCAGQQGDPKVTAARCEVHPKELNHVPLRHVVLDEVHHIKDPRAKQTRAVWYVTAQATVRKRWGTTGTMLAEHIGDTWSIMHALAPIEYPTRSKWMDLVALQAWNSHGGLDVVGIRPDNRAMFFNIFDPRYRRVTLALVEPQIPGPIRTVREVEMTRDQRRLYDELAAELAGDTADGQLLVAPNHLVASTRLLQVAAATVKLDKGDDPDDPATWSVELVEPAPKLDELERILEELNIFSPVVRQPVVVLGVFIDLLELAAKRLEARGLRVMLATGKQTEWERDQAKLALDRKDVHVVIASIAANKEAVDWSSVDTMIFLQRSWSMVEQLQVEARNSPARRSAGDPRRYQPARLVHVVTVGTREARQVERLLQKESKLEELNRDREALLRAGRSTADVDGRYRTLVNSTLDDEVGL